MASGGLGHLSALAATASVFGRLAIQAWVAEWSVVLFEIDLDGEGINGIDASPGAEGGSEIGQWQGRRWWWYWLVAAGRGWWCRE